MIKERMAQINAINSISLRAEGEILVATGLKMRVILVPDTNTGGLPVKVDKLLHIVCSSIGMLPGDYLQETRRQDYAFLRILCAMFLRHYTPLSLVAIGEKIDVDHTTVIHYLKRGEELLKTGHVEFSERHEKALAAVTQWIAI